MNPEVSVIVPVYNVEKYFDRCMESLLTQTLNGLEIILVDDGSTDFCSQKCDQYASTHNHVQVIHKKNAGLGLARNSGLELAKGDYVAFLDSDDFVDATMYQTLYYKAAESHADMVCCDFSYYSSEGRVSPVCAYKEDQEWKGENAKTKLLLDMLGSLPECHSDVVYQMSVWKAIYRREILIRYNIQFPSERELIAEDLVFHTAFFPHVEKVAYINKPLYYYCENQDSLTSTYKNDRYKRELKLYLYLEQALSCYPVSLDYTCRLQRTFIGRIRVCMKNCLLKTKNHKEKKYTIRAILFNSKIRQVFCDYDYSKLYLPYRIFVILYLHHMSFGMNIYFKLIAACK